MKKGVFLCCLLLGQGCQPLVPLYDENRLTAVGSASINSQHGDTKEEKQFNAMRASKLDAYKELSEQVYGVQVMSDTMTRDQVLDYDQIQGTVSGLIRAAKVTTSYQVGDSYITEMELDLYEMKRMTNFGETYHVPRNDSIIF